MIGFQPNLAGIIFRGRGTKVAKMVGVAPRGALEEGTKCKKYVNFKHLLLKIQKYDRPDISYLDASIDEE